MRISLNWLKDYVQIDTDVDTLAHEMTMLGLEIESIERPGDALAEIYVGHILSVDPHPDADKLVVCKTDVGGEEPLQIVCGAKNMKAGDKVPTAVVGAELPGGFKIARRKMRGIESQGMMCSASELGLSEDHSGLLIMREDAPIGADVRPLLGLDDVILEIEVTPNRGDTASMIGVAREIAALHGQDLRLPEITIQESGRAASELSSVTIEAPDLCPRYMGRVMTGIRIAPSPQWLCKRLIAAGQPPINNIVDITNYVLLETGHPLHAFDYDKLGENRIVVRRPNDSEKKMRTLDDVERDVTADMLLICDGQRPQAVAGIMGGGDSEVSDTTTSVLLESAVFHPASIRATSRALGLISEASQRFQRGADPNMAEYAINRATALMQELGGATVAPGILDEYSRQLEYPQVRLRYARCNQLLGTDIAAADQRATLEKLGFALVSQDDDSCTVQTPSWRPDVSIEADLIEEVGRFFNYDNITVALPHVRPQEQVFAPQDAHVRKLRTFLAGQGLTETIHWTFTSPEDIAKAGLPEEYQDMVKLANPLSEKQAGMQTSLVPSLLANAAHNLNRGAERVATFEIAPVFKPAAEAGGLPTQERRLAILLSGHAGHRHWDQAARNVDFYDLKGHVEAILERFGLDFVLESSDFPTFQPGAAAQLRKRKRVFGQLGKVRGSVLKNFDIEDDVYLLELDLEYLLGLTANVRTFAEIPTFPPSLRDMAVVVEKSVPAADLLDTVRNAGGKLLQSVEVFDIYTGEPIAEGRKSVALGLTFQSPERTLTDKDTQKSWDKILKALEKQHQAQLR